MRKIGYLGKPNRLLDQIQPWLIANGPLLQIPENAAISKSSWYEQLEMLLIFWKSISLKKTEMEKLKKILPTDLPVLIVTESFEDMLSSVWDCPHWDYYLLPLHRDSFIKRVNQLFHIKTMFFTKNSLQL